LPHVQVLHVAREKVPNLDYGMTFGQEGAQEPPFLEGNTESITLLVPKAAEEILYFAVSNDTLHVSVVPHAAVIEGTVPSTGVLWEGAVRFFQEERLRALGFISNQQAHGKSLQRTHGRTNHRLTRARAVAEYPPLRVVSRTTWPRHASTPGWRSD
jgi:hypothetical protein